MAVYLISEKNSALPLTAIKTDPVAKVVLISEGVYLALKKLPLKETYVCLQDVQDRGLEKLLPAGIKTVNWDEIIKLITNQDKVFSF